MDGILASPCWTGWDLLYLWLVKYLLQCRPINDIILRLKFAFGEMTLKNDLSFCQQHLGTLVHTTEKNWVFWCRGGTGGTCSLLPAVCQNQDQVDMCWLCAHLSCTYVQGCMRTGTKVDFYIWALHPYMQVPLRSAYTCHVFQPVNHFDRLLAPGCTHHLCLLNAKECQFLRCTDQSAYEHEAAQLFWVFNSGLLQFSYYLGNTFFLSLRTS